MTRSETLFAAAQKVLPGGVNSPVRACRAVGTYPRFLEKGKGSHVWDADGNEYIDLICSWGPLILGHCNEEVEQAVLEAVKSGLSFGAPTAMFVCHNTEESWHRPYDGALSSPVDAVIVATHLMLAAHNVGVGSCMVMHFDPANFSTCQILLIINVMDMIILNNGKYSAQMSHNTCLTAVVNVASSDNMRTDVFFRPPFQLCLTDTISFCLCTIFIFPLQPFIIIVWLFIFSKRYTGTLGM